MVICHEANSEFLSLCTWAWDLLPFADIMTLESLPHVSME